MLLRPVGSIGSVSGASGGAGAPVVLTFDDGPDPRWTPELLDLLSDRGTAATFFVLTGPARRHPDLVRRMVDEGHDVALHGEDHTRLTTLPIREMRRRTRRARDELRELTGQPVSFFRPPYGAQSIGSYLAARLLDLDVVVWGPYAAEWEGGTADDVAMRALRHTRSGSVLLLHDGLCLPPGETPPSFDRTAAFATVLDGLQSAGLRPTSLSRALADGSARRTAWFRG